MGAIGNAARWAMPVFLMGIPWVAAQAADMSRYRRQFFELSPTERRPYFLELAECVGVLDGMRAKGASLFGMDAFSADVEVAFVSMPSLDPVLDRHWSGAATREDRDAAIAAGRTRAGGAKDDTAKKALLHRCVLLKENYRAMVSDNFTAVRDD